MLTAYPPGKRLENQQQETFALNLSKGIRIKGEFAQVEKTNTQTEKMPKALGEPWWWTSEARARPCRVQDVVGKSGDSRHNLFSEAFLSSSRFLNCGYALSEWLDELRQVIEKLCAFVTFFLYLYHNAGYLMLHMYLFIKLTLHLINIEGTGK